MLRFLTAGESHGPALVVTVEGLPAGLPILIDDVADELARRRLGYGRGPRLLGTGAHHRGDYQFSRFFFTSCQRGHQADPSAHFPFSQKGERVPDGVDFILHGKHCRVEITQQSVANRSFRLDQSFELADL